MILLWLLWWWMLAGLFTAWALCRAAKEEMP